MIFDDATARQIAAARPDAATWLTANAGSGKTRVLTDRVARLLLSGVDPQNVLCLTYTKAAAGEMQNRLFRTLGAWAMLDDAALRDALRQKGIDSGQDLNAARRLFARAIETPGGLKIQTIHAFCSGLLRRFPLEARVSPDFKEMDDRSAELLRQEVLDALCDSDDPGFDAFIAAYTGAEIEGFAAQIMARSAAFSEPMPRDRVALALGAAPDDSTQALLERSLGDPRDLLRRVAQMLRTGGTNDNKAADKLSPHLGRRLDVSLFQMLCDLCLVKTGASANSPKIGKLPTKAVQAAHPDTTAELNDLMQAVADLRQPVLAQEALARTELLYGFARAFVPRMQERMAQRGLLGFDDLIHRARDLLSDPAVANWVLWRLDGGIDHILVDEAQDTSPDQWAVIRLLAQEFAAGKGARSDQPRTLFVVGDRKQSIYSFQGADPDAFDQMRAYFDERLAQSETPLHSLSLDHSFRSSPVILDLVDRVFTGPAAEGLEAHVSHIAFDPNRPGRVDLWAPLEPEDTPAPPSDWTDPVDQCSPLAPDMRLAKSIAAQIRHMVDHETLPVKRGDVWHRRPITEGDILILVRRRADLFHAILRECKAVGLRMAGADRLRLGAELAVNDLRALLRFLALPEDDLALATALRSPLFGWSEQDLFTLAHGRDGYLWAALRASEDHPQTRAVLDDLRAQADYLRPYDLIARMLTRHEGRQALLARLGAEAEEGINALLSQALAYETAQVPSLTGFLVWLEAEDVEVKRQVDSGADALRVMTVHGAKGLEAPIVILPDTAVRPLRSRSDLTVRDDLVFWRPKAADLPDALAQMVEEDKTREAQERRRLLYVAMTRAETWLIVAAAGKVGAGDDSWHAMIDAQMQGAAEALRGDGVPIRRLEHGAWEGLPLAPVASVAEPAELPPPFGTLPPVERPVAPLSPSDLGGAKVLPGEAGEGSKEAAMARGTVFHALLEHLPRVAPAARAAIAARIVGTDPAHQDLPDLAIRLLDNPRLASVFTEGQAELGVTADLPGLGRITGAIDRLIVRPDRVIAIDFKTNRIVPARPEDTPEGLLRQMGAYAAALGQIWGDKKIETAILWVHSENLMILPPALTQAALGRVSPA